MCPMTKPACFTGTIAVLQTMRRMLSCERLALQARKLLPFSPFFLRQAGGLLMYLVRMYDTRLVFCKSCIAACHQFYRSARCARQWSVFVVTWSDVTAQCSYTSRRPSFFRGALQRSF
jgi:hypothetical protein